MVSVKFEPYENWLPPGYVISEDRRRGPVPRVHIVTPAAKVKTKINEDSTNIGELCYSV